LSAPNPLSAAGKAALLIDEGGNMSDTDDEIRKRVDRESASSSPEEAPKVTSRLIREVLAGGCPSRVSQSHSSIEKIKLIPEEKTAAFGIKYFGKQYVGPRPPLGENLQALSSAFIVECLWKGVSGDADLFCRLFRGKYRYDSKGRTWFAWHNPFWEIVYSDEPWGEISSLTTIYEMELRRQLRRWGAMEAAERENSGNYTALTREFARRHYALTSSTARRDK